MIASIYKLITDKEGASRIIFDVPSSELINVVKLNSLIQKELRLDVRENNITSKKKED